MIEQAFILLGFAVFSLGIAGLVSSRNIFIMLISAEVILISATLVAVTFFYFNQNGSILPLLFSIWAIAAAEAIMIVAFYKYLVKSEMSLDVEKLTKLRE